LTGCLLRFVEPAKKRSRLVLPEPQITDHELQTIVKVGQSNEAVRAQVEDAGLKCDPTWSLHSDPLSNLQTLRTTASQDNIPMVCSKRQLFREHHRLVFREHHKLIFREHHRLFFREHHRLFFREHHRL